MTAGVVLVSLNLRLPIGAVAPLLPQIQSDLGMSDATASLLTTIPVLCFAGLAPAAARLSSRTGPERAVTLGLLALGAGTLLRPLAGTPLLLAGTAVVGAGITVGNVLVPVVVHRLFRARTGEVIGMYSAALPGGAALAAALAAPIAALAGWRVSLAVSALVVAVGLVAWILVVPPEPAVTLQRDHPSVWRDRLAWALAVFFGTQALAYYAMAAWLPTLLQDPAEAGLDAGTAGWALSVFNLVGIVGSLAAPTMATRAADQRGVAVGTAAVWVAGTIGLALAPAAWPVWVVLAGVGQGAGIGLALALIGLRAGTPAVARGLSGMVQGVGYAVAAAGPFAFGALHDVTGSWVAPLLLVLVALLLMGWAAIPSGRPGVVHAEPPRAT